jgi:hypothetical protein
MFYQARYYDPIIGRFTSADTIVPDPANPQDLNRYSYVRNNPLLYTDPSGHWGLGSVFGAVKNVATSAVNLGKAAVSTAIDIGGAVVEAATKAPGVIAGAATGLPDYIGTALGAVKDAASEAWEANQEWVIPALEFGKNVAVVATAVWAAGAACVGSVGLACPLAAGVAAGVVANIGADEGLDCVRGDCGDLSFREAAGQAAEGAFLGGTGTALGIHAARYHGLPRAAAGLLTVARYAGPAAAVEVGLVQWLPRVERPLVKYLVDEYLLRKLE